MMKIEEEAAEDFMNLMRENGRESHYIDPLFAHMVTSGYFTSFFEIVRHSVPRDEAFKKCRYLLFRAEYRILNLLFRANLFIFMLLFRAQRVKIQL